MTYTECPICKSKNISTESPAVYKCKLLHKEDIEALPDSFKLNPDAYVISTDGDPWELYEPVGDPYFVCDDCEWSWHPDKPVQWVWTE